MSSDKTLELGTRFTADIKGISNGVQLILQLLKKVEAANQSAFGSFKMSASAMNSVSKQVVDSSKQFSNFAEKVNKATQALDKHGKTQESIGKRLGHISGFTQQLKSAFMVTSAYTIAGTAVFAFINTLKQGVKTVVEFDQSLHDLQAISGATSDQVVRMGEEIKRVSHDTRYSTKEIADGMTIAAQAGLSAEESIASIGAISKLAAGTLSGLEDTVDLVTTTIRAYNLEATETSRITDVMANAANKSKLNMNSLRTAFSYVAATAGQLDMSIEETTAAMMALADSGLKASMIGTGLRQVLARLMSPNKDLREIFEANSLSLDKINPKVVGFQTAIKNLIPVLWDNEKKAVDMAKAYEMFGLRGANAAAIIVEAFVGGNYDRALKAAYEIGTAEKMAAVQGEGLSIMWDKLINSTKLLAIELGEDFGLVYILKELVKGMRTNIDWAVKLSKALKSIWRHTDIGIASDYLNNVNKQAESLKEEALRAKEVSGAYKSYIGALESFKHKMEGGQDVRLEYINFLRRAVKDHPELSKVIDLNNISYANMDKILKSLNSTISKTGFSGIVTQIKQLKDLQAQASNYNKNQTNISVYEAWGISHPYGDINKIKAETREVQEALTDDIVSLSKMHSSPKEFAEKQLGWWKQIYGLDDQTVAEIKKSVMEQLQSIDDFIGVSLDNPKGMPGAFKSVYDKLVPTDQGDFLKKYKDFKSRIAELKKAAQMSGEEFNDDILKAEEDRFLENFQKSLNKKKSIILNAERELANLRVKLATDELAKLTAQKEKDEAKIEAWYAATSKKGVERQEIYNELKLQLNKKYGQEEARLKLDSQKRLSDIQKTIDAEAIEDMKRQSVAGLKTKEDIRKQEETSEIKYLQDAVNNQQTYYNSIAAVYKEGSKEELEARKQLHDAILALKSKQTDFEIKSAERSLSIEIKMLKEKLKHHKKWSNEWIEIYSKIREIEGRPLGEEEKIENQLRYSHKFFDGVNLALRDSERNHRTYTERIASAWTSAFDSMGSTFNEFLDDAIEGKLKSTTDYITSWLKSVAKAINQQISQALAQAAMQAASSEIGGWLGGIFGGIFDGGATSGVASGGTPYVPVGSVTAAMGKVFSKGKVVPFASGGFIVNKPTLFPMAEGAALIGEGDDPAEGVLPLKRGKDGKLGVRASGGSGTYLETNINVTVEKGQSSGNSTEDAQETGDLIARVIKAEFQSFLRNEFRPGGMLNQGA